MVAWHRLRILYTSRCIRIWGIAFHSSRSIRLRSRIVETGVICLRTARPSWSHRCSMGLRSGLHAGHSIRSTRWVVILGLPDLGLSFTSPVFLNLVFNLEMVLWPTPNLAATTLCLTPASSWSIARARSRLDNLGMFAHCWQTCILTMVSNTGHWVHSEHLLSSFTISELSMKEPKRCWLVWILWTTAQLQFWHFWH